jgi:hypothetical protein
VLAPPHLWSGMLARHQAGKEKVGYHHEHARQSQAHAQATGWPLDLDNRWIVVQCGPGCTLRSVHLGADLIDAMHLEHLLCKVEPDGGNCRHGRLFLVIRRRRSLYGTSMPCEAPSTSSLATIFAPPLQPVRIESRRKSPATNPFRREGGGLRRRTQFDR